MRDNGKKQIIFLLFLLCTFTIKAQSELTSTFYFMENVPLRQKLNPAFQPKAKVFISLPILGYTQRMIDNNLLTLTKIAKQKERGRVASVLLRLNENQDFHNVLYSNTAIGGGTTTNLFSIGFRAKNKDYWTFSSSISSIVNSSFPISPAKLILYREPEKKKTASYSLGHLEADMTLFSDLSANYSTQLNKKWVIGAKLSLLVGHLHSTTSNNLILNTGSKNSNISGELSLQHTIPGLSIGDKFKYQELNCSKVLKSLINGAGASLAIGVSYKLTNELTLSGSLNELGAMHWFGKNSRIISGKLDHNFDNIEIKKEDNTQTIDKKIRELVTEVQETITETTNEAAYTSQLSPNLNIAAEYAFFEKRLSLGFVSSTIKHNKSFNQNLSFVANTTATPWLDFSLTYSQLNGRTSSIGSAIALRTGSLQWFCALGYNPLYATRYNQNKQLANTYNKKAFNFSAGISILLESAEDKARTKEKFHAQWKRKKKSTRSGLYRKK